MSRKDIIKKILREGGVYSNRIIYMWDFGCQFMDQGTIQYFIKKYKILSKTQIQNSIRNIGLVDGKYYFSYDKICPGKFKKNSSNPLYSISRKFTLSNADKKNMGRSRVNTPKMTSMDIDDIIDYDDLYDDDMLEEGLNLRKKEIISLDFATDIVKDAFDNVVRHYGYSKNCEENRNTKNCANTYDDDDDDAGGILNLFVRLGYRGYDIFFHLDSYSIYDNICILSITTYLYDPNEEFAVEENNLKLDDFENIDLRKNDADDIANLIINKITELYHQI